MDETIPPIQRGSCGQISEILGRVGDKWTVLIIMTLHGRPHRFNEIKRAVGSISQQMLTRTLKNLERDGMITRTVHSTVPPQVEYALADLGRSLAVPVVALGAWAQQNLPAINEQRHLYDSRHAPETLSSGYNRPTTLVRFDQDPTSTVNA